MKTNTLGQSELSLSRIGLGTWAIGGPWEWGWGDQDDDDSIETIHRALEIGINWIDTAPAYGLGHSESVIGKALKQTPHKPFIFTKCGVIWDNNNNTSQYLSRESIQKEVHDSLRRLDVDVIDLYQIHWPGDGDKLEEAWTAMAELQHQEKVRYIGVCNFSVDQLKQIQPIAEVTSVQPHYSLIIRDVEKELLPYCGDNGMGVINYSPMGSGLLTGKMTRERLKALPADDWRHKSELFQEPLLTKHLELVERMKDIASDHQCSVGEIAVAWCLHNPVITGAIVGMRRPEQVDGFIHVSKIKLSEEEIQKLS